MNILKAFLLTLLWIVGSSAIGFWIFIVPDDSDYYITSISASSLITGIITLIFMVLLFRIFGQHDALRFDKAKSKYYISAIILGFVFVFFQSVLVMLYYLDFSTDYIKYGFRLDRVRDFPLLIVSTVIMAPIVEELYFRNFILRGLLKKNSALVAILVSSVLFAIIHIPFEAFIFEIADLSFRKAFTTFFGGLLLGLLYYKSKSIIPPILMHMVWNLTVAVF